MKVGDLVEIRDGSYSACYAGENLYEEMAIACQPRTYIILLIQDGLPAFRSYPGPKHVEYTNNALLQDVNDPTRLVFTRTAFLRSVTLLANGLNGSSLAEALKNSRATAIELFGSADCSALILEMARVLQRTPGHERDIAYAKCILKMQRRLG
ncbi:MAG: hypothetical protein ACYC35_00725 [Pirellulales bacterium]